MAFAAWLNCTTLEWQITANLDYTYQTLSVCLTGCLVFPPPSLRLSHLSPPSTAHLQSKHFPSNRNLFVVANSDRSWILHSVHCTILLYFASLASLPPRCYGHSSPLQHCISIRQFLHESLQCNSHTSRSESIMPREGDLLARFPALNIHPMPLPQRQWS